MRKAYFSTAYISLLITFIPATAPAWAQVANPSFEGIESGSDYNRPLHWDTFKFASVVESFMPDNEHYLQYWATTLVCPVDQKRFVLLSTANTFGKTEYSSLTQTITIEPGERLSGSYFFGTYDYMPWNDYATITLIPQEGLPLPEITLVHIDVQTVGDYKSTAGWRSFEHFFDSQNAGIYDLVLLVANFGDFEFPSFLAVDNINLCTPPEHGNINGDCVVDFTDFAVLAENWLQPCSYPYWCNKADLDHSQTVDQNDLQGIARHWLAGR